MPLFFQQDINPSTKLALWRITEPEVFFLERLPVRSDIRAPQKRLQHLAGRHLLQVLEPGFPYPTLRITDAGRPFMDDLSADFSISHTSDVAAAIFTRKGYVGIDVEMVSPRIERVMRRFLHSEELSWVEAQHLPTFLAESPSEAQWALPTLLWSVKEAVFKWQGGRAVEFSDDIRVHPFELQSSGSIEVDFKGSGNLQVGYSYQGMLCLAWVVAAR